jgi:pantothenate kinase
MGGGTLIGLCKLLIDVDNYNDIMTLAKQGDNTNVDLLVGDIYSGSASNIGLESDVIASSFGKISEIIQNNNIKNVRKEDVAKSLLSMICFHIGQIAFLMTKQKKVNKYIFNNIEYIILVTLLERTHML